MQTTLKTELTAKLSTQGIIIEDVLLKDIKLPAELSKAIELKAQAGQDAARMEFVLQKERQEAERKAIEAKGIADFQRIVSEGISAQLLQWKGVEGKIFYLLIVYQTIVGWILLYCSCLCSIGVYTYSNMSVCIMATE